MNLNNPFKIMLNRKNSLAIGLTLVLTTALSTSVKAESFELNNQSQQHNSLQQATNTNFCVLIPGLGRKCFIKK